MCKAKSKTSFWGLQTLFQFNVMFITVFYPQASYGNKMMNCVLEHSPDEVSGPRFTLPLLCSWGIISQHVYYLF